MRQTGIDLDGSVPVLYIQRMGTFWEEAGNFGLITLMLLGMVLAIVGIGAMIGTLFVWVCQAFFFVKDTYSNGRNSVTSKYVTLQERKLRLEHARAEGYSASVVKDYENSIERAQESLAHAVKTATLHGALWHSICYFFESTSREFSERKQVRAYKKEAIRNAKTLRKEYSRSS